MSYSIIHRISQTKNLKVATQLHRHRHLSKILIILNHRMSKSNSINNRTPGAPASRNKKKTSILSKLALKPKLGIFVSRLSQLRMTPITDTKNLLAIKSLKLPNNKSQGFHTTLRHQKPMVRCSSWTPKMLGIKMDTAQRKRTLMIRTN